jgi:predicted AAA+ superfamily ATPase
MGTMVEPLHLKAKVKEVSTPKFYFFDCGIVEALSGNLGEPLAERVGTLFETLILNELRIYNEIGKRNYEINYWGTPSQNEVDFILSKGKIKIGIEVKFSKKWKAEFSKGLDVLLKAKKIKSAYVVYNGEHQELHDQITALPFKVFCKKLYAGELI